MPRGLRYPLVDVPQHVIQCGRNRQAAYPWSSYRWHALGHPDLVVTDHPFYLALARTPQERQQVYQALF
jgi:hypothetical protein